MNYATIKPVDIANGEGVRVSLFVSGCRHHCKNCFNPETWNFSYGKVLDDNVCQEILDKLSPDYISGFTILGGEPFEPENQPQLLQLTELIKKHYPNKNIWCYTGFLMDKELLGDSRANTPYTKELLKNIDVLVDGRFVEELKNISLKFRGSSNQRVIDVQKSMASGTICLYNLN